MTEHQQQMTTNKKMPQTIKFCTNCQAETERDTRGRCRACHRKQSTAYRTANRELVRKSDNAWYAANKEKAKVKNTAYAINNAAKLKQQGDEYRATHRKEARARTAAWRAKHPELIKANIAAYFAKNPGVKRIHAQNRLARKRAAGGRLSKGLLDKLFGFQQGKCACCGLPLGDDFHLDHIMPLALGGSNTDDNIQLLRSMCNIQKHAQHPIDFMQSRGFLL